jgi:release factor glutamine methyltransferase
VTIQAALLQGTALLDQASVPVARLTAEVLLAHALHQDRTFLYVHGEDELTQHAWIHYGRYLNERLHGKPTQYITHLQEFFGREFFVDPDVLIPRPETEHLVELAVAYLAHRGSMQVIDVGTGSGAIAISVALEARLPLLACDISAPAVGVAERNRAKHRAPVNFFVSDLVTAVRPRSMDLILSNPPYVPAADAIGMQREVRDWEPHVALFGGQSGLEVYRQLIAQAEEVIKPGGRVMLELGYQSLADVREMLTPRWSEIEVADDLAGWPRVIQATFSPRS